MKAAFYTKNRSNLQNTLDENSVVIIAGNVSMQMQHDTAYPFTQNSNFLYFTGLESSDLILIITKKNSFLILPDASSHADLWDGSISEEEAHKKSGINSLYRFSELNGLLMTLIRSKTVLKFADIEPIFSHDQIFSNPAQRNIYNQIKSKFPLHTIASAQEEISALRSIKDQQEIEEIRQAIGITLKSFEAAEKVIRADIYEYDVAAAIKFEMHKNNTKEAYPSIIAGGKRACTLHYNDNDQLLKKGQLVLIDAGAKVSGYSADVSRTLPVGAQIAKKNREVFNAVLDIKNEIQELYIPGASLREIEQKTVTLMKKHLIALGYKDAAKKVRDYYPHSIGHHLGLDTHDVHTDYELRAGMVITCEPGIYIPKQDVGVRLEDDILITDTKPENLSASIPIMLGWK